MDCPCGTLGYHAAAWRHPDAPRGATLDINYYANNARIAERGKFDMVFLADGIGIRGKDEPEGALCRSSQNVELEPLTLLSALAPVTSRIGLISTASTTYNDPYQIARKFASLDHLSGGRAGWNIVTSGPDPRGSNFGREHAPDHDPATSVRPSSSRSAPACGTVGRTMPSYAIRQTGISTIRPSCTCSIIMARISTCADR